MALLIRKAKESDMEEVLDLIRELATFEKEPDAVEISTQELIEEGFGNFPLFVCFVAEEAGKILGAALVYFRFSTWKGRSLHLEDLIVSEQHRGKGIGTLLYRKVMEYAYQQNVSRVEWVVLDWNHPAIAFYEKSGANLLKDWYLVQMDKEGVANFIEEQPDEGI